MVRAGSSEEPSDSQPGELSPNVGDGRDQAAACACDLTTSIPSVNCIPSSTFGNWLGPSSRRQLFWAPSSSLNTIASAVLFDRQPFERIVRCRTVANVLSIGFVVSQVLPVFGGES